MPGRTVMGPGALEASETAVRTLGKKAFVVTGKIVTKSGLLKRLTDLLDQWGIAWEVYNDITGEPTVEMIENGVNAYKKAACDFIAAIGGGSPLDSAKAIAAMTVLDGKTSDYMGKEIAGSFPPMVLIPTTAGTGSEATKFTIITDTATDVKMLLKGDALLPEVAVIDSSLTVTSPPDITAATGMDALTHAVESYTSRKANPLTDIYALDAIKRIFAYLPLAYKDGNDGKAREELAIAAYEAGVCISNASVTIVHGMSRPIGALFHVPHGISNAMLIKDCLEYVLDGCYERFAEIARAIGAADIGTDNRVAACAFITALGSLCRKLEIPTLIEYGIDRTEFERQTVKMAKDAMKSGSPSNTVKEISENDILLIYERLWK
jgi:alcohol dehydrogenase class IV